MSLSADIIRYLETLTLKGGDHDSERFKVLAWERRFIRGAFTTVQDSGLTVGRGNGKSALVAGLACAVVDPSGPLHGTRRHVDCFAASFDQGRTIFEDVLSFLGERYDLHDRKEWRLQDSANRAWLEYRPTGARVRCLGSDPSKAHGLRSWLALADEPAQWDAAKAERMIAAIKTGMGKSAASRLIALGTRPASEEHWFSRLLRSAACAQVHAADKNDPPFRVASIRKANPSWDHLPSLRERILQEADEAKRDPSILQSFRALRLNQGVADTLFSVLIDSEVWRGAEGLGEPDEPGRLRYVLGVDLGQNAAMSAVSAYFSDGKLEAIAAFPELPSLAERGLADGVGSLYQRMHERGELMIAGRRVSDIAALLREARLRWGRPVAVVCDRWRAAELKDALEQAKFPLTTLIIRGMGFLDGGSDLRDFRRAILSDLVRPSASLLLRAAMSEARAVGDAVGNWKLAKSTQGGRRAAARDDAAASAVLAVAEGFRRWHAKPQKRRRRYFGAA